MRVTYFLINIEAQNNTMRNRACDNLCQIFEFYNDSFLLSSYISPDVQVYHITFCIVIVMSLFSP